MVEEDGIDVGDIGGEVGEAKTDPTFNEDGVTLAGVRISADDDVDSSLSSEEDGCIDPQPLEKNTPILTHIMILLIQPKNFNFKERSYILVTFFD